MLSVGSCQRKDCRAWKNPSKDSVLQMCRCMCSMRASSAWISNRFCLMNAASLRSLVRSGQLVMLASSCCNLGVK